MVALTVLLLTVIDLAVAYLLFGREKK